MPKEREYVRDIEEEKPSLWREKIYTASEICRMLPINFLDLKRLEKTKVCPPSSKEKDGDVMQYRYERGKLKVIRGYLENRPLYDTDYAVIYIQDRQKNMEYTISEMLSFAKYNQFPVRRVYMDTFEVGEFQQGFFQLLREIMEGDSKPAWVLVPSVLTFGIGAYEKIEQMFRMQNVFLVPMDLSLSRFSKSGPSGASFLRILAYYLIPYRKRYGWIDLLVQKIYKIRYRYCEPDIRRARRYLENGNVTTANRKNPFLHGELFDDTDDEPIPFDEKKVEDALTIARRHNDIERSQYEEERNEKIRNGGFAPVLQYIGGSESPWGF